MTMEKRRGGVAFQVDKTYKLGQFVIPQADLYKLACEENIADLVKKALAEKWISRWMAQRQQQAAATQHVSHQHVAQQHADATKNPPLTGGQG